MASEVFILMGISGCGKTTIGKRLSEKTGLPFFDGDDFHPDDNKEKMRSGVPLTDTDRLPWLDILTHHIKSWIEEGGAILACSALKKEYRTRLRTADKTGTAIQFIYLKGSPDMISERMKDRNHEFMPAGLLESQYLTLEEPDNAFRVDISHSPEDIVMQITDHFSL